MVIVITDLSPDARSTGGPALIQRGRFGVPRTKSDQTVVSLTA